MGESSYSSIGLDGYDCKSDCYSTTYASSSSFFVLPAPRPSKIKTKVIITVAPRFHLPPYEHIPPPSILNSSTVQSDLSRAWDFALNMEATDVSVRKCLEDTVPHPWPSSQSILDDELVHSLSSTFCFVATCTFSGPLFGEYGLQNIVRLSQHLSVAGS